MKKIKASHIRETGFGSQFLGYGFSGHSFWVMVFRVTGFPVAVFGSQFLGHRS